MIPGITAGGATNPWTAITGPFAQTGALIGSGGILRLVGLGEGAASRIWESDDGGASWTGTLLNFPNSPESMILTSSRVIILGQSGTRGRHKPLTVGGAVTNSTPEPIANSISVGMAYNGTRVVLVTGSSTTPNFSYISDNNGTSWTQSATWSASDWGRQITFGAGYFYIGLYQSARFYYSTDGATWLIGTVPAPSSDIYLPLVIGTTVYLVDRNTGDVYSSPVGSATMTLLATGTPIRNRAKVIDGVVYARGLDSRSVVTTTDFVNFITYPQIPVGRQVFDITTLGGLVYVGSSAGFIYSLPIIT